MHEIRRIRLSSWNRYATRFVYAPVWEWESVPNAAVYEIYVGLPDRFAAKLEVAEPRLDMSGMWSDLPCVPIDMLITVTGKLILGKING